MKTLFKKLKGRTGQSMAEFAVTTAMMATLATTAAPKFSGVGEGAKGKKTEAEIDKIMKGASNFYSSKVTSEGRGRFPGQEKYNVAVGGYTTPTNIEGAVDDVETILKGWKSTDAAAYTSDIGSKWRSVFGVSNSNGGQTFPSGAQVIDDPIVGGGICCEGDAEWLNEFGDNPIKTPFQDGHYIYIVVPGGGAGNSASSPTIFVADLESPGDYYKKYAP